MSSDGDEAETGTPPLALHTLLNTSTRSSVAMIF
jgi:hypothetical protein